MENINSQKDSKGGSKSTNLKRECSDIKQEMEDDRWLKEWAESGDTKIDFKQLLEHEKSDDNSHTIKVKEEDEFNSISGGEVGIFPDQEVKATTERDAEKASRTKVLSNKDKKDQLDELLRTICKDAPVSDQISSSLCLFKCSYCNKMFRSWDTLLNHCVKVHKTERFTTDTIKRFLYKTVSHVCKICADLVPCESFFLRRHLSNMHRLKIAEYKEKYMPETCGKITYSSRVIGGLSVFTCKHCGHEFHLGFSLKRHMVAKHSVSGHINVRDCLSKVVYHKCKLCSRKVLCESTSLWRHFKATHSMSMAEYSKKTGCSLVKAEKPKNPTSLLKSLKVSNEIDNTCVFLCSVCNKRYFTVPSFRTHVWFNHSLQPADLSESLVEGRSYKCKVCSALLLCDKGIIGLHYRQRHNLTEHSDGGFKSAANVKIEKYNELRNMFLRKTPESSKVWDKPVIDVRSIPIDERNSKIGNLCQFKCSSCADLFTCWDGLRTHLKAKHKLLLRFCSSILATARYHCCLMCPRAVLSDRTFLSRHLKDSHKMKLPQYEKIFRKNGGEVLPNLRNWRLYGGHTAGNMG